MCNIFKSKNRLGSRSTWHGFDVIFTKYLYEARFKHTTVNDNMFQVGRGAIEPFGFDEVHDNVGARLPAGQDGRHPERE